MVIGCDQGYVEKLYSYNLSIENDSNVPITINGYRTKDLGSVQPLQLPLLMHSILLPKNSSDKIEKITLRNPIDNIHFLYPGFRNNVDSLVLKFNNMNKDYVVHLVDDTDQVGVDSLVAEKWIPNKSSLLNVSKQDLEEREKVLYYKIMQSDYENVFEL